MHNIYSSSYSLCCFYTLCGRNNVQEISYTSYIVWKKLLNIFTFYILHPKYLCGFGIIAPELHVISIFFSYSKSLWLILL